ITVAAVEFMPRSDMLEALPESGITAYLYDQMGTLVKALAVLGAAMILAWFGLRPAARMLLDFQPTPAMAVASAEPGELPFEPQIAPAFAVESPFATAEMDDSTPDLISDLTSQINRTPQKRLEQMVDFDEDQAIAIMKQW